MSKTVIEFDLTESSIDRAIEMLRQHEEDMKVKSAEFRRRVAEKIQDYSASGFSGAIVDDLTEKSGGARMANVTVTMDDGEQASIVIANGTDAIWVEFGAGVYHNGAVGSSPNPYGSELGFTIGGYGINGRKNTWGFTENGRLYITHGTPATMPMYNAVQRVINDISEIAKGVFG